MAPTGVAFPGRLGLSCITICQKKRTNLTGCTSQCLLIVELVAGQFSRLETAVSAEIWGWFIRGFVAADVEWESWIYFFFLKKKTDLKGRRVPWWWPSPGRRWNGVPVLLLCVLPMNERNNEKWSSFLCVGPRVSFLFFSFLFFYRVAVTRTRMSRLVFFFGFGLNESINSPPLTWLLSGRPGWMGRWLIGRAPTDVTLESAVDARTASSTVRKRRSMRSSVVQLKHSGAKKEKKRKNKTTVNDPVSSNWRTRISSYVLLCWIGTGHGWWIFNGTLIDLIAFRRPCPLKTLKPSLRIHVAGFFLTFFFVEMAQAMADGYLMELW